jgi:hypothetical protein
MLNLPIEWDAIVAAMLDFASIPVVPAIAVAVLAISLVVYLLSNVMSLISGVSGGD